MKTVSKIMKTVVALEKVFLGAALALATVIIMISVIGRRLGSAPQWSEEGVRYLMIWITFIGSGLCFRRGNHYGIDVIRRVPGVTFQKFVSLFIILVNGVFGFCLLYYGYRFTAFTMMSKQMTAALRWPIWIVYISVPIGGALVILHLIEVLMSEVLKIYTIEE